MLLEIAAANAAFAVIKETVQNSGDLLNAGKALIDYFDNKSAIQSSINKKEGDRSDLEEFIALEKLKQQEVELKELMIYSGRGGMWDEWLAFQAQAARARREAAEKAERELFRKKARRAEIAWWTIIVILSVTILGSTLLIVKAIVSGV